MTGANFDLYYLSYFQINFQNSCGYHAANIQGCPSKLSELLSELAIIATCLNKAIIAIFEEIKLTN